MKAMIRVSVALLVFAASACGGGGSNNNNNNSDPKGSQLSTVRDMAKSGQSQCMVDSDCGIGAACKGFCGNGWCGSVCVATDQPAPASDCQKDSDCAVASTCQTFCGNGWCAATCVPGSALQPTSCKSDADCGAGLSCKTYCGNGWCASSCVPAGCTSDSECDAGSTCQGGTCTPKPTDGCVSDASCPAGQACRSFCGNGWCQSRCLPQNEEPPGPTPMESCVQSCGIGACAPGLSCWSDGSDYLCNDCVAACHGAVRVDCPAVQCTSDAQCSSGSRCTEGQCQVCGVFDAPRCEGGIIKQTEYGNQCYQPYCECSSTEVYSSGACRAASACDSQNPCATGETCSSEYCCIGRPSGMPCVCEGGTRCVPASD